MTGIKARFARGMTGIAAAAILASVALAHSGVQNPAVKARMMLMGQIKDATAILGGMAKGKIAHDAAQAAMARAALIAHSGEIAAAFEAADSDPKSEALPAIWNNWQDFRQKADAMTAAAEAMGTGSPTDIGTGMAALGRSCGGCHKLYRIEK